MLNVYEEIADASRRHILAELRSGSKSVSQLCAATGLKQPNVSNHLARMKARGIVRANKVGRQVFYGLASPEVESVVNSVFSEDVFSYDGVPVEDLAKEYARAAVQGDEQTCGEILDHAFRAQLPLVDIYQDILAPAMTLVGNWWKVEAIDEAQEHMASAITERMMARTAQIMGPVRRSGRVALLGCAPNSWHVIGLRMIGDFLRLHGWRILFLGANVPVRSFLTTVRNHNPSLVLLSCGSDEGVEPTIQLLGELARIRDRRKPFTIGVGGLKASEAPAKFLEAGADFTARDLRTFAHDFLPRLDALESLASDGSERN
jgi:methanogenic corrinoid protein MtbC1